MASEFHKKAISKITDDDRLKILQEYCSADIVKLKCQVCGEIFFDEEPKMCCSGRDCGCMGLPIDPIVCSQKCFENIGQTHDFKNGSASLFE